MSHDIAIGLLGCGTVGSGVVKLLQEKHKLYTHRVQASIGIAGILVRDPSREREGVDPELLTDQAEAILDNPDIQIVVEVMGGIEPARSYILQALHTGKHVVTANKALIAQHGPELFEAAHESGVALHFEAAVAGGIPIIQTLKRSLASNTLRSVYGIINGTTNYILSAMTEEGRDFDEVLREAQEKGFAESDPTDDVEGFDAAYKLAILASLIFNKRIDIKQIHRVGIQRIAAQDIAYAKQFGYVIKLLAIAKRTRTGLEARVNPTMIPADHPLASVNGVYNALMVRGDAVGDLMFYGRGAGQMPTASAVVSDILNIAAELDAPPNLLMGSQHIEEVAQLSPPEQVMNRYYLRIQAEDKSGVLGQMGQLLGKEDISIHTLIQTKHSPGEAELVLITHPVSEQKLRQAVAQIRQLEATREIESIIRLEDFAGSGRT
ncbi:MAG: homoserine dehydrogenase [Candidatus Sericytochromatia bacterium]